MQENLRDSAELASLFRAFDELAKPIVARVQGAALGGGTGLVAVCDVVVAAENAIFGTTEVRLGVIPAVISPYLVHKIGESRARAWFVTGERVSAKEACEAGLVHRIVPEKDLATAARTILDAILLGGPRGRGRGQAPGPHGRRNAAPGGHEHGDPAPGRATRIRRRTGGAGGLPGEAQALLGGGASREEAVTQP